MILIVAATQAEVVPLTKGNLNLPEGELVTINIWVNQQVDILITGVGAIPTVFHLTRAIHTKKYDLIVNAGIAGAYQRKLEIGEVVVISEDLFADYGVDDRGNFVSLFDAGLADPNKFPFRNGRLTWPYEEIFIHSAEFQRVKGITVSTSSGSEARISELVKLYSPAIETMESAAVFYSCLLSKIPFICLRAISNYVEPRNIASWNISKAVSALNEGVERVIRIFLNSKK